MPVIELKNLTKTYPAKAGPVHAVDGVSLTVQRGEVVALLGPNGAGKTTALDIILGLGTATSGEVTVLGGTPARAVAAGRIAALLQTGGLLRDITVRETATLIASTYREHRPVDEVLEHAGIFPIASRRVSKCSGGEQQRLKFALALLPDPELLVLDEPTTGMDVTARREFWQAMHAEAANGRTVVFATHYLEEADHFANRVILMANGRVVADGPTDEIRGRALVRHVTATVQDVPRALAALESSEGVSQLQTVGHHVSFLATDSDEAARLLLGLGGRELTIATGSLEDAFVALTGTEHAA